MEKVPLYCPQLKTSLSVVDDSILGSINKLIASGSILNAAGEEYSQPIQALLVDSEQRYAYPVTDGIPQLLPLLAISLEGLNIGNYVD